MNARAQAKVVQAPARVCWGLTTQLLGGAGLCWVVLGCAGTVLGGGGMVLGGSGGTVVGGGGMVLGGGERYWVGRMQTALVV